MCRTTLVALLALALLPGVVGAKKQPKEPPQETHDGLVLLPDRKVALAYMKPGADLSDYSKVMLLDTYVAFKKGWDVRQQATSIYKITAHDMNRIKEATAELFREVLEEKLSENDGFPIVDAPDMDVLLLRPAIIDLEVTSPDTQTARSYNFASTAGEATLYLELFDSVSGEILARALDHQVASNPGQVMRYSNRVTNRAAAREVFASWAGALRRKLDMMHAMRMAEDPATDER